MLSLSPYLNRPFRTLCTENRALRRGDRRSHSFVNKPDVTATSKRNRIVPLKEGGDRFFTVLCQNFVVVNFALHFVPLRLLCQCCYCIYTIKQCQALFLTIRAVKHNHSFHADAAQAGVSVAFVFSSFMASFPFVARSAG